MTRYIYPPQKKKPKKKKKKPRQTKKNQKTIPKIKTAKVFTEIR